MTPNPSDRVKKIWLKAPFQISISFMALKSGVKSRYTPSIPLGRVIPRPIKNKINNHINGKKIRLINSICDTPRTIINRFTAQIKITKNMGDQPEIM